MNAANEIKGAVVPAAEAEAADEVAEEEPATADEEDGESDGDGELPEGEPEIPEPVVGDAAISTPKKKRKTDEVVIKVVAKEIEAPEVLVKPIQRRSIAPPPIATA